MRSLKRAIAQDRRERNAERLLRKLRVRIFDYEDAGPETFAKAKRIMAACQGRLVEKNRKRRAAVADRKLQRTPSAFEPGACR